VTREEYLRRREANFLAAIAGKYPAVGLEFGHWFAGFFDGEGSLGIYSDGRTYRCTASIQLRADDEPILYEIIERLGMGALYRSPGHGNTAPQVSWRAERRTHCFRLVELFDAYPLRAKKARDYAIWRQAVFALAARRREHGWDLMALWAERLKAARVFSALPPSAAPPRLPSLGGADQQLRIDVE
jgi:hypothetical protein